ncbi:MAG TPA: DUF885 domain-containing protein [Bryobacteraceae bacterium]|nr:DUF885 domain-containing protein [Bryobacteraceae bacterium]
MRSTLPCSAVALLGLLNGCASRTNPAADFEKLTQDFIYGALALSPVSATGNGYHVHNGVPLDELVDDYSAGGLDQQRNFYKDFQMRIAALDASKLDREQRVDLDILRNNIELGLLELDTIQSYKHNPTIYVELAGNALFTPYMLNYAPLEKRFDHITRRLERLPALFDQAKAALVDAPEVWNRVAQEENDGNIGLIDKTLRDAAPESKKAAYGQAAGKALAAVRDFNSFLKGNLSARTSDWRLGKERYARKFALVLASGRAPEDLLAAAEADLKAVRAQMVTLAAPKTVEQALADIAKQHATPDTYLAKAKETLRQATAFVKEKDLLTLPSRSNLDVIETPEFMRGIYGVGGFNAAPPLEPQLGAFYWITPIPKNWPAARVESKLREYNNYGLQQLTIHEAMPGHYVQLEYANDVQPVSRRLLRTIFANTPYVEGWAVYTQQMMSDAGYLNGDKGLWLTFYKQILRVLANTILDVRLQTMGMTDQQALDLMMKDTYQEKEEATAKLQRAQLSSCQLPTYFVGWKGWLDVREHYKQRKGSGYSLKEFHERALKESGVPLPALEVLLQ